MAGAGGSASAGEGRRLQGALPADPDAEPGARDRRGGGGGPSDLIYISTEHAPSEEGLLGPTIRYVLAHRPCRVVVEHDPTTAGNGQNGDGVVPAGVFVGCG